MKNTKPRSSRPVGLAALTAASLMVGGTASAQTVPLNTTVDSSSFIFEATVTGSFAQISQGNGALGSVGSNTGDADGLFDVNTFGDDEPSSFGSIDIFPRETAFEVGGIFHAPITGTGTETVAIESIDLGGFFTPDPARTDTVNFSAPTVISDISDYGLGLWFFNGAGGITFDDLDADDTVTFTDGELTSIDLELASVFSIDVFGTSANFDTTLTIVGNQFSYQSDAVSSPDFVIDITGTVDAVVPEPASISLLILGGVAILSRRR
ncbi:MAG: PEP-CTERM sorting domain-containing protein [Planctomycetota bacterium]